ncbi:hypothetical protein [Bacillus cereus]|uniref:Uncharacterized protein n=1 Tax=Bacillus cereus TaxID=1396 RepID=A0A9X7GWM9_BACCE|nr:hypothetical protein [Bacillus cereus]PGS80227.1 hypothetical protein COC69_09820 [Bacillus cereus]PGW00747.1 hypothetical protein COD87_30110 [Bacillus cereus]
MSAYFEITLITKPYNHLWNDALHARDLASKTTDEWMKGTYVRWSIVTACMALESYSCDALGVKKLSGRSYQNSIDTEIQKRGCNPINWNSGLWKDVLDERRNRNYYTHSNDAQEKLWPDIEEANKAIDTYRDAIKNLYSIVGKQYPDFVDRDSDPSVK